MSSVWFPQPRSLCGSILTPATILSLLAFNCVLHGLDDSCQHHKAQLCINQFCLRQTYSRCVPEFIYIYLFFWILLSTVNRNTILFVGRHDSRALNQTQFLFTLQFFNLRNNCVKLQTMVSYPREIICKIAINYIRTENRIPASVPRKINVMETHEELIQR